LFAGKRKKEELTQRRSGERTELHREKNEGENRRVGEDERKPC
jgi:hypothetical protein